MAILVGKDPLRLAPNSAQIPVLIAETKQNVYNVQQEAQAAALAAAPSAATPVSSVAGQYGQTGATPFQRAYPQQQVNPSAWCLIRGRTSDWSLSQGCTRPRHSRICNQKYTRAVSRLVGPSRSQRSKEYRMRSQVSQVMCLARPDMVQLSLAILLDILGLE